MHNLFDVHRSHHEDSNVALLILGLAVVGFLIYFVMGTPVDVHRTANGSPAAQQMSP